MNDIVTAMVSKPYEQWPAVLAGPVGLGRASSPATVGGGTGGEGDNR